MGRDTGGAARDTVADTLHPEQPRHLHQNPRLINRRPAVDVAVRPAWSPVAETTNSSPWGDTPSDTVRGDEVSSRCIDQGRYQHRVNDSVPRPLTTVAVTLPVGRSTQLIETDGSTERYEETSARPRYDKSVRSPS